jgi:predicted RNA-binding Zn ribbon-like protein
MEPRELPIVAGHLALDFANTVDDPLGPTRHDHIGTYPELLRWSVRAGALPASQADGLRGSAAALRKAHALRDVLNDVFVAVATGTAPAWGGLRPFAADAVANSELSPTHELIWPAAGAPHAMLWPVAYAAERLLTSPDIHRVKQCAGCPWVFLDHSRNASRRWCAMNDCGTHAKVRKYVAKRAAARKR